jgi:hypothetical protein
MKFIITVIFSVSFFLSALSHSGRTDSRGGHHDRKNGGYHYHHGMSAHQHPNGICPYDKNSRGTENKKSGNYLWYFVSGGILAFGGYKLFHYFKLKNDKKHIR